MESSLKNTIKCALNTVFNSMENVQSRIRVHFDHIDADLEKTSYEPTYVGFNETIGDITIGCKLTPSVREGCKEFFATKLGYDECDVETVKGELPYMEFCESTSLMITYMVEGKPYKISLISETAIPKAVFSSGAVIHVNNEQSFKLEPVRIDRKYSDLPDINDMSYTAIQNLNKKSVHFEDENHDQQQQRALELQRQQEEQQRAMELQRQQEEQQRAMELQRQQEEQQIKMEQQRALEEQQMKLEQQQRAMELQRQQEEQRVQEIKEMEQKLAGLEDKKSKMILKKSETCERFDGMVLEYNQLQDTIKSNQNEYDALSSQLPSFNIEREKIHLMEIWQLYANAGSENEKAKLSEGYEQLKSLIGIYDSNRARMNELREILEAKRETEASLFNLITGLKSEMSSCDSEIAEIDGEISICEQNQKSYMLKNIPTNSVTYMPVKSNQNDIVLMKPE